MEENKNALPEEPVALPAEQEKAPVGVSFTDGAALNKLYKNAVVLSKSSLLPERFRNKPEDILILIDMSSRMRVSLYALSQALYLVHGTSGITGQFCISLVNSCGRFQPLSFVFVGTEGERDYGCYAITTRIADGIVCKSTTITVQMAVDEGWMRNTKWKTMTSQMLMYRAAAFFARVYCPDVLCGMYTTEELHDVYGESQEQKPKRKITFADIEEV